MGLKLIETLGHRARKIPLKKMYYLMLVTLIGLPIITIFIVTLLILNQQFKQKAIENIRQMQQTLITQLAADVDDMSLRMTSMIYANNYEVMEYAAGTDTDDIQEKEQNRAQLKRIENLYLDPNKVYIGGYDTLANGDLFMGGKQDMLILIGVLKPDINTDSSGKIEMVELYQSSKVADQIKDNNRKYEDTISDMESRMYAKPEEIRAYLEHSPKKPFLLCEYMHDMGNSLGGMKDYMDLLKEFEKYQGGFIWDFIDQALWVTDEVTGQKVKYYYECNE